MSTAKHIIDRAASLISVKLEGSPLTDEEYNDALDALRDTIFELQSQDVRFRFDIPENIDDEVHEFDWVSGYLKHVLAVRIAPEFTAQPTQDFYQNMRAAERVVLKRMSDLGPVARPDILPIGAGNEWTPWIGRRFYVDDTQDDLKTGSGGPIFDQEGNNILKG